MIIELDIVFITKIGLNINEYLTLLKAYFVENRKENIPFLSDMDSITELINKGYLTGTKDELNLTNKAINLFEEQDKEIMECIKKIFLLYPAKTPNGRILRAANIESNGKKTYDFIRASKKIKTIAKNVAGCKKIYDGITKMVRNHEKTGRMNYLPQLITTINQHKWEEYLEEENYDYGASNFDRL